MKNVRWEFVGNISKEKAEKITNESCKKLLVNQNTQTYTYEIKEWLKNLLL